MTPEEALEAARAAAERARARGAYGDDLGPLAPEPVGRVSVERLLEWAVIEPDLEEIRSTRRLGAPITAAKRALVRVLRQYHGQVLAQQTRFNLHAALRIAELEDRVERAERGERDPSP